MEFVEPHLSHFLREERYLVLPLEETIRKVMGGGGLGEVQIELCKGKLREKTFMHSEETQ